MSDSQRKYGFHKIYDTQFTSWKELEQSIAQIPTTKEKGDAFEQFCYFYFRYHKNLYKIKEIWCDAVKTCEIPSNIRKQYKLKVTDYGVDGVSRLENDDIEAWQAKFRSDRSSPTVKELSTFWAEAEYTDSRRIIANSQSLPERTTVRQKHVETLVDKLIQLSPKFFEALHAYATEETSEILRPRYSPLPHQQDIIDDVIAKFQSQDRGKLIAACGIGKTLVALWITERLKAQKVLILAPSIALVGQTLREWIMHRNIPFAYLGVCSDQTIDSNVNYEDVGVEDLDFSVTTDIAEITKWLNTTSQQRQYIFCTYHSSYVIEEALKIIDKYKFDIIVFDEAHRTVGKADHKFATALSDERIPSDKRLFMTATEKLISPQITKLAERAGQEVFSMTDQSLYGSTLHEYNFGQAIEDGIIADYEIVLTEVTDVQEKVKIEQNKLFQLDTEHKTFEISANELFKATFLLKALASGIARKTILFHSFRKNAVAFHKALTILSKNFDDVQKLSPYFSFVLGNHNAAERATRIESFRTSKVAALGNVQVLSEGVDMPLVDAIYFVDPKTSLIDLVQAIGRALRKPFGKQQEKVAKIIVPIIIPDNIQNLDEINWDDTLQTFHHVIQAMRDQDARLAEEIDSINEYAVTKGVKGKRIGSSSHMKITVNATSLNLRETVSLDEFLQKLTLRIATANANPEGTNIGFSHLGQGERQSQYKTNISTMGDYNPQPYRDNLVLPTLDLFMSEDQIITSAEIGINNNNRSHCKYLGVIKEIKGKRYCLTRLGRLLKSNQIKFDELFMNQLLLFQSNNVYSYRIMLKILIEINSLNHYEFLYGPYIMQTNEKQSFDYHSAIHRIKFMRQRFPNIQLTSVSNRDVVREQLNEVSPVQISHKDLWGDRTTVTNKFRYMKNALRLFSFINADNSGYKTPIVLKTEQINKVKKALELSDPIHAPQPDFYGEWLWITDYLSNFF